MKKIICCSIFVIISICNSGCDDQCRLPGCTEGVQHAEKPNTGSKHDVTVTYENNCGTRLTGYFIELNSGDRWDCSALQFIKTISDNENVLVTVHSGKIGYIAFTENSGGKCGSKKSEAWISVDNSTGPTAYFNICP